MKMQKKLNVFGVSLMLACSAFAVDLNPVMWADVPDISVCRKGDTYYMTSTSMHFNPGVPVMASKDLVNWKIVSYCYETVENRPKDRLDDGGDDYGLGTWASSIRYNEADGYFYVSTFNNRVDATYVFRTKDIEKGEWEHFRLPMRVYDHSLWIEDGKFYFFATKRGSVELWKVKDGFTGFDGEGKTVIPQITDCVPTRRGLGEGTQVFKRGDYYYVVNICWPQGYGRSVAIHRGKSMTGPWEGIFAYACEGIAQGSLIETPDGKWYAYLFGDRGGVGRIPYIIPVEWENDWPVFPKDETGRFVRPALAIDGVVKDAKPGCVEDDEFDYGSDGSRQISAPSRLKKAWQFNHNPDNANWSVTARPGWFRITTSRVDGDMLRAKNTLTQRTFGPVCQGVTKLDFTGMKPGDVAGLALFQALYGFVGVEMTENGPDIVLWQNRVPAHDVYVANPIQASRKGSNRSREKMRQKMPGDVKGEIWFKAVCDFRPVGEQKYDAIPTSQDTARFYWSADGKTWHAIGEAMYLPYSIPHFTGYRFALFNYATKEAGGFADFDFFRTSADVPDAEKMKPDGSNPILKTHFSPDPAPYVDGDTLYVFTGHDEPNARGYVMRDWQIVKTKDLVNWESLGAVLDCGAVFPWAKPDGAWAAQAIKRGGKWYWYLAVFRKGGDSCIAVAVADRVEGPWKDALGGPLVEGRGYIDPSVFIDDDGQAWLFWGNCGGNPGCWYAPLKENMVELAGDVKPVPGLMDEKAFGKPMKKRHGAGAYKDIDTNFEEAPWIYKLGDTYYLEYAAGGVPEHWAYSTSKSIHGPWTYRGRIMDEAEGTGTIHGGSIFFKGDWYLLYHNATLPGGAQCRRSACIERYTRNPDGSIPHIRATKEGVSGRKL